MLTTLPPSCAECLEIWEPKLPENLRACPGLFRDCLSFCHLEWRDNVSDGILLKSESTKLSPGAGIATCYGPDGPGIEFRWGRDFPHLSRPAVWPTQPPIQWAPGLSRGKGGRDVALTKHPFLASRLKKDRATPLLLLWAFVVCSKVSFTFTLSLPIISTFKAEDLRTLFCPIGI